jgi:type IV pilus assembly protein PilC
VSSSDTAVTFSYEGFDADGRPLRGRLRAPSLDEARQILRDQQVLVGAIRAHRLPRTRQDIRLRGSHAKLADVAWFARSLASAVEAGLPVATSLDVLAAQRRGTVLGDVIVALHRAVTDGVSLPRAFAVHEPVLGRVVVSLVEAGSESAALGPALAKAAEILETQVNIRRKVVAALVYPCAVLAMALLILMAMILFVVPTFVPIFAELDSQLPLPTRILVGVSEQARSLNGLAALVLVVALVRTLQVSARSRPAWQTRRDRVLFGVPLFGSLFEGSATSRLCWTLSGLVESGVALQRAVVLAGEASGSTLYREAMTAVARDITNGRTLAASLAATEVFPPMMVNLAQMGERTARTDVMLGRYAKDRELEVAAKVEGLTSLLEPLLIGALGGLVGLVVIALYAPLFGVIDKIR